jgi:hypothetical protein
MRWHSLLVRVGVLGAMLAVLVPSAARGAPVVVEHDVTTAEFFPDDICGPRAVFETTVYTTSFRRITESADGTRFQILDLEVGTVFHDFVDPSIPDVTTRIKNTFTFNITPGGTWTETETFRQSDGTLTITFRFHFTAVDGVPKVVKEVFAVSGCP